MYIKQLSVFIENKEGRLEEVLDVLKEGEVNIISLSLADTAEYGMLRLIVADPQKGYDTLKRKGFSAMLTDVLAVRLAHKVGQLQELLGVICKAGINIEYMYAIATVNDDASIVFKTSDLEKAVELLEESDAEIISSQDIASM